MSSFKLRYFNAKGFGEVSRLLFALAEKEYEDIRYTREQWQEAKPTATFKQMPVLEVDGVVYTQSGAINRYLAKKFGFYGDPSSDIDFLKVEQVLGIIGDVVSCMIKVYFESDETKKAEHMAKAQSETLPFLLGNLNTLLKTEGTGFFVGSKITLADVSAFDICEKLTTRNFTKLDSYPELKKLTETIGAEPRVKKWLDTRPVTEN